MPFRSPIDLSPQTRRTRYRLIRHLKTIRWILGFEECLSSYRIDRPNGFPTRTVELILRGNGIATAGGKTFPLRAGTLFSYGQDTAIAFAANGEPMTKYFISALTDKAWSDSWFARITPGEALLVPGFNVAAALFEQILSPGSAVNPEQDRVAENLLEGAAAWVISAGRSPGQAQRPDLLQRANEVLEAEFCALRSVMDWAARINVSPSHLCRVFKEHHHRTPYAELTDRKLQHAYRRLNHTSLRIEDIAREVGYEDPFHFSRLFKRRMGFPPSHLR